MGCAEVILLGSLEAQGHQPTVVLHRREASPGKLGAFEDDLFRNAEMADVPIAAALILGYPEGARTIGIAFCDAAGRALGTCEFADDEYFCSTESVLVQLGAKEVVMPKVRLSPLLQILQAKLHHLTCMRRQSTCMQGPGLPVSQSTHSLVRFASSACAATDQRLEARWSGHRVHTQEGDAASSSADASRLRDVISRCNALCSERAKSSFSTKHLEQDLIRLLRSGNAEQHRDALDRPLAAAALSGVSLLWPD